MANHDKHTENRETAMDNHKKTGNHVRKDPKVAETLLPSTPILMIYIFLHNEIVVNVQLMLDSQSIYELIINS